MESQAQGRLRRYHHHAVDPRHDARFAPSFSSIHISSTIFIFSSTIYTIISSIIFPSTTHLPPSHQSLFYSSSFFIFPFHASIIFPFIFTFISSIKKIISIFIFIHLIIGANLASCHPVEKIGRKNNLNYLKKHSLNHLS